MADKQEKPVSDPGGDAEPTASDEQEPASERETGAPVSGDGKPDSGVAEEKPKKPRRWLRRLSIAAVVSAGLGLVLWIAIHRIPWLGAAIADGLRSIIGVEAVTKLEDFAYGVQDRFNRLVRSDSEPEAYWEVPSSTAPLPTAMPTTPEQRCVVAAFQPKDVGPVHQSWFAPGDGKWLAMPDPQHADEPPRLYKTLLHPDKNRSWAAITVVAVDRRTVDLYSVAGRYEPKAETKEAKNLERPAVIPKGHHAELLAAFNGGFKAEHGHYGMRVGSTTIIRPRVRSCWVAAMPNNELVIGDWERLKEREPEALWWRQTPACMVENGKLHPGLVSEKNTLWGATLDRNTVIRRSAIGVSEDGLTLYAGIGDDTTATAMARGMFHAGAFHVAQLDVNWSYPKFVVYRPRDASNSELVAEKIAKNFEFSEDEYIRKRAARDFFYLVRKPQPAIEKVVCGAGDAEGAGSAAATGATPPPATAAPIESAAPSAPAPAVRAVP